MNRVKITLAYDGSRYYGFQVQKSHKQTVAHELYKALHSLQIKEKFQSSGRTDRGVHSRNQVIHIDLPHFWKDYSKLKTLLNFKLPESIRIKQILPISNDFHARYSAKKRCYHYILTESLPSVFESAYLSYHPKIDHNAISKALDAFIGKHDFIYFQKSGSSIKTSVRHIYQAKITKLGSKTVISVIANGFLRSQIRLMVAALLEVSDRKLTLAQLREQIDTKARHTTALAAPNGLYLSHIYY